MEVKKGYKQTEVGVIPEDWVVKKLGEIAEIDPDNLSNSTNPEYHFKYISLENVDCGTLRNITELVFKDAPSRARRKIKKEDILVSTVRPNLKSHLLIKEEVSDWVCSTGFSVLRCKGGIAQSGFVFNHFFASIINKQIENLITGSNYPAVNSKELRLLQIPLPPTKAEQTAIAAALSDADALIQSLEKLIAKKRSIKQGAMQELLKPKEGWVVKKLGEIAGKFVNGGTPSTKIEKYWTGNIPWITGADILDQKVAIIRRHITNEAIKNSSTNVVAQGNLLLVSRTGVGKLAIAPCNIAISQDFTGIYAKKESLVTEYIFHFFDFNQSILKNQNQGTSIQGITRETLMAIPIPLPPTKAEQTRIAAILSDMDADIAALETKLAKYKQIKQGVMQELLTGRTRLI